MTSRSWKRFAIWWRRISLIDEEVLEGIGQEARTSIQHIRAALARIDAGTYGVWRRSRRKSKAGKKVRSSKTAITTIGTSSVAAC